MSNTTQYNDWNTDDLVRILKMKHRQMNDDEDFVNIYLKDMIEIQKELLIRGVQVDFE